MTKKKAKPEDDAAIARDVAKGLELVELSVEWALRRVKEPACTAAERKKIRAELQRVLDTNDGKREK